MKQIACSELKRKLPYVLRQLQSGQRIQILKRGKPFAIIMPQRTKGLLGCMEGTVTIPKDFDSPLELDWMALR